ncbi:DUF7521 family protein [Halocalculus aciditolerans]|uniref:Uncharacterized protein n=1 Tax=Halocalculus aciditolerans TaxID=1383812 RepID=A0A830FB07_9EURY|nr:hypothetical protein [Halocalculus aciditolerans]GGL57179.1 hypothetical protein GCM10009039_14210 [Halocalculus aciditolerans]
MMGGVTAADVVLGVLRVAVFGTALGLTVVSYRAYRTHQSKRLEYAFVGFAFISMGAAMTNMGATLGEYTIYFEIAKTIPFLVGFSMLYASLYR